MLIPERNLAHDKRFNIRVGDLMIHNGAPRQVAQKWNRANGWETVTTFVFEGGGSVDLFGEETLPIIKPVG